MEKYIEKKRQVHDLSVISTIAAQKKDFFSENIANLFGAVLSWLLVKVRSFVFEKNVIWKQL